MNRKLNNGLIVLGTFLTIGSVVYAYDWRGYFAIGGEWLIAPALFLIKQAIVSFIRIALMKGRG